MNYENDDHQHTEYVRASTKYRCGRAARWGKPCWQGPDDRKKCGGTSECSPVLRGDRYYCQRPKSAGGACVEGPLPDGSCAHNHLPCRPRDSIRMQRGKFTLFGLLIIVILLALFSNRESLSTNNAMISPDQLSSLHAGYPITDQCENCHKSHNLPASAWLMSAFSHQDMTEQCVQCHVFKGEATAPHNMELESEESNVKLECIGCHREHKGADFDISKVSNEICGNCHEQSFTSFAKHSPFPQTFPHQQPQNIFFDHAKHIGEYFVDDEWINKPGRDPELAEKAKQACNFCHQVETAQRDIKVRDYQTICAGCHEQQIQNRAMTILTPDEVSPALFQLLISNESGDEVEQDVEDFTPQLIEILASDGLPAVYEKMSEAGVSDKVQRHLFTGLESGLIKTTANLWSKEDSLDSEDSGEPGWFAAENDDGAEAIFYRAEGHADSVMRSWVELYINKVNTAENETAGEVLAELLDLENGPGACGKCHGSMAGNSHHSIAFPLWGKTSTQKRIYTSGFSHRPHIDLLSNSQGCDTCHKLSDIADYQEYFKQGGADATLFQSSFEGIKMESCINCHNQKRISDDCQLCHVYHKGAGFKFEYQKREIEVLNP